RQGSAGYSLRVVYHFWRLADNGARWPSDTEMKTACRGLPRLAVIVQTVKIAGMSIVSERGPGLRTGAGEPAWELALLFPQQGAWSEDDYLALNRRTNWPIELSDGRLEVLPMPTPFHQRIVKYLFKVLEAFVLVHAGGEVFVAPLPIRLRPGKLREPDVLYLR